MTDGANKRGPIHTGRVVLAGLSAAALVVFLAGSLLTRGAMENLPFLRGNAAGGPGAGGPSQGGPGPAAQVDQRPWQTAAALAPLAVSAEEQGLAREAERLADHEVDQAFATALRRAEMETHRLSGEALVLQQKVNDLTGVVKDDQARVDSLTSQAAKSASAVSSVTDDLDVAKAQLQLDTDELSDATQDLTRESGDKRTQIQQELAARQAAMKKYDSQANGGQIAVIAVKRYATLAGRIGAWFDQKSRRSLLQQAQRETDASVAKLTAQHTDLEQRSGAMSAQMKSGGARADPRAGDAAAKIARMTQMHAMAQIHSALDDRLQTAQQLSAVYAKWGTQVELQHGIVQHLILQSMALIAGIILFGVLTWWGAQALLDRSTVDARSLHTLRTIASFGIQSITLVLVLLVIFGAPSQVPTILGLGAAGLTVVFQDFILAFFGWFVLMGRNGIRVGDWVEINGVGGEVVEIGLFRTALLETGNWTDKGYPTGRRVTFINNFAISGQFFNFSTAGQWMWDEISVNVPPGEDTYETIEAIHKAVLAQTAQDAKLAEAEWKGAPKMQGLSELSTMPSVDMRPAASGIDILVRYVTRANDRFDKRNRLYHTVIALLHGPASADGAGSVTAGSAPQR